MAVLLLSACIRHRYPSQLLRADSLCNSKPDSAALLLRQLKPQMAKASKADRMFYELLRIKTADKTDRPIAHCDSAILHLINYYEQDGDPAKLAETYYYAGRIYYEKQDAPQALDYFKKAEESANDEDAALMSRIYSQQGYIFYYQELFDEMKAAHEKACHYARVSGDTTGMIYALRDIAVSFESLNRHTNALEFYGKARRLAVQKRDSDMAANIDYYLATQYYFMGQNKRAFEIMNRLRHEDMRTLDKGAVNSLMARLMRNLHFTDSAIHYFHLTEETGNMYAKDSAYRDLALIYLEEGDIPKSGHYFKKYFEYEDTVKSIKKTETTRRVMALYNFQKKEEENLLLKEQNSRKTIVLLMVISMIVLLSIAFYAAIMNARRKNALLSARYAHLQRIKEDSYRKSQQYIEANKRRITELESQLTQANQANTGRAKALHQEIQQLKNVNAVALIGMQDQIMAGQSIRNSAIYQKFTLMAADKYNLHPSHDDWQELEELVNQEYPRFTRKLREICVLTEQDYRMSLLIKANMKPLEIAKLLNLSKSSVAMKRARLYRKHFGKDGSSKEWDNLINSL